MVRRRKRHNSGRCLGRLLIIVLVIALMGVGGYWFYGKFFSDSDVAFLEYYKKPIDEKEMYISPSHYDYTNVARVITSSCEDNIQKIRAIYLWICDNIEYDTSYTICSADECFDSKKGVCQAYCELFYHIAKAAGINCEIISGKAKDFTGYIDKRGHVWLFAYTRENYGILLDPTWGAGSLNGNHFKRRKNCWEWFNVPPEWMVLSHFPNNESYQLIDNPLSMEEFISLKPVSNLWIQYGLNVHELFMKVRNHQIEMPNFYSGADGVIKILDMPMCASLRVGEVYEFRIQIESDKELTIINNKVFTESNKWKNEGNGVYSINYMVKDVNCLKLSVKSESENIWHTFIEYQIDSPSTLDWEKVEKEYPLSIPEVKNVKNLDAEAWEQAGIGGHTLLKLIREKHILELPVLYTGKGQKLKISSVPMNRTLVVGESYTFRFKPESGTDWAIINGDKWYREWEESDGYYTMTISPTLPGELKLSVQFDGDRYYWPCLVYLVKEFY